MEARWLLIKIIIIPIRLFNVRPHSIVKWVDIVARRTRPCLPTAKDLLTLRCKDGGGGWMDDGDDMATQLIIRLQVELKLKALKRGRAAESKSDHREIIIIKMGSYELRSIQEVLKPTGLIKSLIPGGK